MKKIAYTIILVAIVMISFGVYKTLNVSKTDVKDTSKTSDNSKTTVEKEKVLNENTFLMGVEDVFTLAGRGIIVTGLIKKGSIIPNDTIEVIGMGKNATYVVTGILRNKEEVDSAKEGDYIGLLLRSTNRDLFLRGQVVVNPDSMKDTNRFEATLDVVDTKNSYSSSDELKYYFWYNDNEGEIELPKGVESISPETNNLNVTITLKNKVGMEIGTEFSIRKKGIVIAKGKVTKMY